MMNLPDIVKIVVPLLLGIGSFSWTQFNSLSVIGTKLDHSIAIIEEMRKEQKEFKREVEDLRGEVKLNTYRISKLEGDKSGP